MPSALLTDVVNTEENPSEQTEEQSGAPSLTDDEDDDEEEIYHSLDEEDESLVTNIPEQTILASLMEGKTPHQKCVECLVQKEESETIAAIADTTEENEDEVSTLFVSLDLSAEEKELCEEKRNQIRS